MFFVFIYPSPVPKGRPFCITILYIDFKGIPEFFNPFFAIKHIQLFTTLKMELSTPKSNY